MRVKIDSADKLFSQYVRLRDMKCQRCFSRVEFNDKGLPISHQASHYFGRSAESTRFDPENVDTLCWGCHQHWGSTNREEYREFKIRQLGESGFKFLMIRNNAYKKKDRKFEVIKWKLALKELKNLSTPH